MLKRSLLQGRQLEAIDALAERAAAAPSAGTEDARPLHVLQLAGTNTNDIQVGLASTLATFHDWRTLIIVPDTLGNSVTHLLTRAATLDRDHQSIRLDAPLWPLRRPPIVYATHGQIREAIKAARSPDAGQGPAAPALITPDDYQLVIANNPNERRPEDYRPTLPFFTGAQERAVWMCAKPAQLGSNGCVRAGVVAFYRAHS